jgi:TP901 family phage tail tape measure protein
MADTQSNIQVSIDTTQALASIKNLQRQISAFHSSMAKGGAAANAVSAQLQQTLLNSINSTGKFAAEIKTIRTTTESFTNSLEKNKFSLGEYFRYAGGASKTFGRIFKTEFDTINKVARENVKDLQTQYIRLGRDASGSMKAIAVRPLSLDMNDLATKTMIASEKQALLNQLLKQGSTNLLNFGKNTQWAGRQLMVGFTLPLLTLGSAASKTFMDMEAQAIRFKKVYGDLFTPQEESAQALKDIQDLGREFTKYGISVSSTVGLAAEAAAAGFQGVDLQRQTSAATKLSILGQVESQKALETTISLQNAFSMSSENLASSIDFLNAVENQTVLSLDDISTAIPKAAPIVQQLGGDVKDLAFLMTAMKEGGINASEGANALKSGLASLINPTGKANEMLLGFGINAKQIVVENKGNLKKTVIEFATALNQLDPLNRAQAIEQMFGKFQFSRLSTLFANVTKEGTQASRVLDLAGSSVQELASLSEKELGMTSESAMNKFKGAVENLKVSLVPLGEEFLKAVTPIAEFVTKVLDRFNNLSDGTKKIIVTMTAIIAGLGPVFLMTFGLLANGIANIIKGFTFLKTVFNKTGQSTATLGTQVNYMTTEQRNAAAVAASLDQVHVKLAQTFTSEASAVNALTQAYQRAIATQAQFIPTTVPIGRGPVTKRAAGKPAVVGGTGNKDSELALLMPGETVIPTDMSKKYGSLINGMIADNIPGYMSGKSLAFAHASMPFAPGSAQFSEGVNLAGLQDLVASFPNMVKVVSNLVAEIPQALNVKMKTGAGIGEFEQDYASRTGKFLSSGIIGGIDASNQEEVIALQKLEDEIGKRTISMAQASKEQKVTDDLFAKATREVIDEYSKLEGSARKAAQALDTSSKQVGQVRVSATQSGLRSGLESGIFRRARKATQTQNQIMFGDVNVGRESASSPGTFYSGNPITPKGSYRRAKKRSTSLVKSEAKLDATAYDKTVEQNTEDIYPNSRKRNSPHPKAAQDGKDDAKAYTKARDKELTQAGRKRRVATRGQGAAPIGATPLPGATVLPIVPPNPKTPTETNMTRKQRLAGKMTGMGGRMASMGGGMGIFGANMALSMAPDFAGKGVAQGSLAGANLGMMFGPYGMAAGAAIGGVTSALTGLIAKQNEQAANVKATFTPSGEIITLFGDKVLNTTTKITNMTLASNDLKTSLGLLSPEVQAVVDAISNLPEDNPLAKFIKQISDSNLSLRSLTGSIRTQVSTAISTGGLDPKNAENYVRALLAAANRTRDFAAVWKSVTKDVADAEVATTTSLDKMNDLIIKNGDAWGYGYLSAENVSKGYNDLTSNQKILSDQMLNLFSIVGNGTLSFDQINERIAGLDNSSIDAKTSMAALRASIYATNDPSLIARFKQIEFSLIGAGKAAKMSASDIMMLNLAIEIANDQLGGIAKESARLFGSGATSVSDAYLATAESILSRSDLPDLYKKMFEKIQAITDPESNPYTEPTDGVEGLSKASNGYLKVLDAEIKALEAKRNAQKNANDEVQRQIDLETKLSDLAKQSALAKISGDFIGAASLQQQAQNVQVEFNQETELRKKDAEIDRLRARRDEISGGAKLTKAESTKLANSKKKKRFASGGMINKSNFAKGGLIKGPGTGKSDSIKATLGYAGGGSIRVSNGEYVVKASSVKDYGVNTMNSVNNGTATIGTNSGGTVYNINMPITSNNANPEGVANEVIRRLKLEVSKNNKTNKVGL